MKCSFELIDNGAVIYDCDDLIVAIIVKTPDGYGYMDREGFHDEGYISRLQCIQDVMKGLLLDLVIPI